MRRVFIPLVVASTLAGCQSSPQTDTAKPEISAASVSATNPSAPIVQRAICILPGTPIAPSQYVVVRNIRIGKGSYGSVNDVLPRLVNQAESLGAAAVINYSGSQRFGFWPWRIVRPVVGGTAVRWVSPTTVDCVALGGSIRYPLRGSVP